MTDERAPDVSMSPPDITRTLPQGEPKGLDPLVFAALLRDAMKTYLEIISRSELRILSREVFQPLDRGIRTVDIPFPLYGKWEWEKLKPELGLPAFRNLLDYIWNQGELVQSLRGPDPDRGGWEAFVLMGLVNVAVARALDNAAIDEAIDTGTITHWRLPESYLEAEVRDQVVKCCQREHRYSAKCPVGYLDMEAGTRIELGNGVTLASYTAREIVGHLTRIRASIWSHDLLSSQVMFGNATMLEVVGSYEPLPKKGSRPKTFDNFVEEEIANRIDLIKWAVGSALGQGVILKEGAIAYDLLATDIPRPTMSRTFKRQDSTDGAVYNLQDNQVDTLRLLLDKAFRLRCISRDLQQSFFYWGRCALAMLDRDQLLDAAIGLEGLLVPYPGESTYRFGLHGTALLARFADTPERCNKDLKEIYRKRSSAAHGSPSEGLVEADMARRYLGNAVLALIELHDAGVIQLSSKVSTQIEALVLRSAPISLSRPGAPE